MLFAQFPAFFLLSILFLIAHLRVRKRSAVKSVLWVLLFGAALAVCFLGIQAKYWTLKTLFELKFWSWFGLVLVVLVLVLRLVFKLQNKHAQHMVEKERTKAEKEREQAVAQAREEGRAEALSCAESAQAAPAPESASGAAQDAPSVENAEKEG